MWNANIGHWLGGSRRDRELQEIRETWERTQSAWRASPIGRLDTADPIGELALRINKESWERTDRIPIVSIAVAIGQATAELLSAEAIGDITPTWDAIESDVSVAVEFRDVLARRARYANDFPRIHGIVKRQLFAAYDAFYAALPESAFGRSEEVGSSFEVPLIELIEDPAELIHQFLLVAYEPDVRGLRLFVDPREAYERNLRVASGYAPDQEDITKPHWVVFPRDQKNKTPMQLADLYLAGTPFRTLLDTPIPFHLPEHIRFEHCHIVGGTGHGKTQLMQRMIHGDLITAQAEKRSVVVIDSQGDLINRLSRLALFSPDAEDSLAERLIVIDPADVEFPPALNLFDAHLDRLEGYRPVDRERVLNGVVEVYENFFGDLLGAELTQKQGVVFKYLARLMLVIPGATIHTLMQLMENPKPYLPYMAKLEGSARYFFETEFFEPSFAQTKKQILRRLWGVLSTPAFERMFAQTANKLDLFQALQDGKIVLINTAKDLLKEEGSQLFGRFFIGMLAQAALERSTLAPEDRTPTLVYVDEAQEYFDDTIETILNQARKYRVGLTLAHQTLDQLSPRLRAVLHANTSMKCAGGVSARDARALAEELHTSSDFIESMKRRQGQTEFACWIRNETHRAIRLAVPLGFLERQPILTEEAYEALLDRNRRRYCGTYAEVQDALRKLRTSKADERTGSRPGAASPSEGARPTAPPESSTPGPAPTPPLQSQQPVRAEPTIPPAVRAMPPEPGKGGTQHKYVQHLIKQLAIERGFRAVIEEQVQGGHVDVGLHRDELSIACEISVTSTVHYEAQNLAKCLRAGFVRVWAIAPDAKRQKAIQKAAQDRLAPDEFAKVEFLTPEEVVLYLDDLSQPEPAETRVRGYRVKVSRKVVGVDEASERRATIARILAQSMRGGSEE